MSVDYIGSKAKLLDFIFGRILNVLPQGSKGKKFLDVCAGSGRVSREAARRGFDTFANDMLHLSGCILKGCIGVSEKTVKEAESHILKMNLAEGISGFFHQNYSPKGRRMYFTEENAKKIDFCREYIERTNGELKGYLLYCVLVALSRVQNTSGHQTSYLKKFKSRAIRPIIVRSESVSEGKITIVTGNAIDVLRKGKIPRVDIAYIDPPYNGRQYGHNYHLYETFVRNDNPTIHGKTGIRDWQQDTKSEFCSRRKCLEFLKDIVSMIPSEIVFVSYSSDGIMSREDIEDGLLELGCCKRVRTHTMVQKRFKHSSNVSNTSLLYEYLFEITKS